MPLPRYNTTLGNRRSSQRRRTALVVRLSDFSTSMVLLLTVGYSVRLIYAAIKSANDNKQIIIESSNLKNTNEQILKILAAATTSNNSRASMPRCSQRGKILHPCTEINQSFVVSKHVSNIAIWYIQQIGPLVPLDCSIRAPIYCGN